ncbi:MAG: DNA sulfur modification protein DndC [Azoarcus sp.]|nr:DNA sulfur modification protein DndC [Azoarcus sp.]
MDLFVPQAVRVVEVPLETRLEQSVATLAQLMRDGVPLCAAFSGGKDSTALMVVWFMAVVRVLAEGIRPRMLVLHANTGIENPVISAVAYAELARMRAYAEKLGVHLEVAVSQPKLLDTWAVRIIGGRALPSVPERQGDCSSDWKVEPMNRLRLKLLPEWGGDREVVTLTGTRFAESAARGQKMRKRGDSDQVAVRNKMGELVLSPLAAWTTDNVWELIGLLASGLIESYTDAVAVRDAYADAGPTSCAVINDSLTEGSPAKGGCGARFGCMLCMQVRTDASMDAMLEKPEYAYLKGVAALRQYLIDTDYDLEQRLWVGRTISGGHVAIRPDVYGPRKLRELFRMAVTLDAVEYAASREAGLPAPRFRLVTLEQAMAIDAVWSINGHWDGFAALDDYLAIHEKGDRYPIPVVAPFPKVELPEPKFLPVGDDWTMAANTAVAGLLDPYAAAMVEPCLGVTEYGKSNVVTAWEGITDDEFHFDLEGALLFLDFEADSHIETYRHLQAKGGSGTTYRTYLQYGFLKIGHGQVRSHDRALKRAFWKGRLNLNGPDTDIEAVKTFALTADEVPRGVLESFMSSGALAKYDAQKSQKAMAARQGDLF